MFGDALGLTEPGGEQQRRGKVQKMDELGHREFLRDRPVQVICQFVYLSNLHPVIFCWAD
jgi:hypothetical protein